MINNFLKKAIMISSFLVAIILISSSSISITISNLSEIKNYTLELNEKDIPSVVDISEGLAPKIIKNPIYTTPSASNKESISNDNMPLVSLKNYYGIWGYIVNSNVYDEGPCHFIYDDPGSIEFLQNTESDDFLSGGTCVCEKWVACENSTGALWEIDRYTGDMIYIGGGGIGLNGLAFDPVYQRLYGASSDSLYEIDPDDGSQELIGIFGANVDVMIAIAFDSEGICWGWDLGNDKLWNIDKETGEATEYSSLGIDLNYAQDGTFDYDTGTLWFTAYSSTGFLAYWDWDDEELVYIDDFQGGSQITAAVASFVWCPPKDVGVKNIIYPKSGYALPKVPMKVTVKNYGWASSEITDVQMQVNKFVAGPNILYEDFTGHFPPDGWTTDYWNQSFTNESGGESPEARCYNLDHPQGQYYDSYIMSPKINCSNVGKVKLNFKFKADIEETFCSFFIKYRKDTNHPWIDVSPWINPFLSDFGPKEYVIDIYGDPYLGKEFQVKWEYEGYYSNFNYWWLDDVDITAYTVSVEYNETVDDVEVNSGEEVFVDFPSWTPTDWQDPDYEDTWQDYIVKSCTLLEGDDTPENDCKEKIIDLYFPWMHDIEITSIDSPFEDGPGQVYPVQATIKNVGQYAECCIHIEINISDLISEYSDSVCQGESIEPGESITFNFDDWTPDFLQNETTGSTDHTLHAEIYMSGDKNPANNLKTEYFKLDYWHDVGIDGISSPNFISRQGDFLWYNGDPDGRSALPGSIYHGYSNVIIDDFETDSDCNVQGGAIRFIWNSGDGIGNLDTLYMWFFEETGDCEPLEDAYVEKLEVTDFSERLTGDYYFDRPEIEVFVEFDDVYLPAGKWWVGFQPDSVGEDIAYLLTAQGWECDVMADLPYWEYPRWSSSQDIWGEGYDLSWQLHAWGHPYKYITIPPGPQNISVIAKNYGTFPELDLVCNAQIWDYIFDPFNGTKRYEDNITDIDLDTPLGGELLLNFEEFTFEYEGRYGLFFSIPNDNDDEPKNNKKGWGIGVDDTAPYSWHKLDPPEPDGENGWYVSDVEVDLEARDPWSNDVGSFVAEIKYSVNGGPVEALEGDLGRFDLTQDNDGDDVLIEYWAVDNVGNEETPHNTFTIDMDQTDPIVDLIYECVSGNPRQGWLMRFTATAEDATSDMDRVEFYLNDVWQETVVGPEPVYEWSFIYHGDFNLDVRANAYDLAGNMASDIVEDPESHSFNSQSSQQQSEVYKSSYFMQNLYKSYLLIGGDSID